MKKNMAVLLLAVMFSWTSVDAASLCSYDKQKELTKVASSVKIAYEEAQGELEPGTYNPPEGEDPETYVAYYDYFKIKIINVTDDIYVKLENNANDEIKYIEYKDTNEGAYTIDWKDLTKVTTFTYTVYSSSNTECPNEQLFKRVMTVPKLNENYQNVKCLDYPDHSLCKKYITSDISTAKFNKTMEEYIAKQETEDKKEKEKNEKAKQNNKTLIIIVATSIIIVVGGVAIVVARKKRGSRVI